MDKSILLSGIPIVVGLITWVYRLYVSHDQRIDMLERNIEKKMDEQEVRLLLQDKMEPVKESLDEIKAKIEKLTDYLIKG